MGCHCSAPEYPNTKIPNIQPEPPLAQLKVISSHPIAVTWEKRPIPILLQSPHSKSLAQPFFAELAVMHTNHLHKHFPFWNGGLGKWELKRSSIFYSASYSLKGRYHQSSDPRRRIKQTVKMILHCVYTQPTPQWRMGSVKSSLVLLRCRLPGPRMQYEDSDLSIYWSAFLHKVTKETCSKSETATI